MGETYQNCPTCGAGESFLLPVWEDGGDDFYKQGDPDYVGCIECRTMHEIPTDPEKEEEDDG